MLCGVSFLVQSIWCSENFLYLYMCFFRKIFLYDFIESIFWAFEMDYSSSTSIILKFFKSNVPDSWMFCFRNILDLTFSLIHVSISPIVSSTPETHSSISCLLLMKPAFLVPVQIPKFFFYKIISVSVSFLLLSPFSELEPFY